MKPDGCWVTESPETIIPACQGSFESFHISEPSLAPLGSLGGDHVNFAAALRQINYTGWASIEMRAMPGGSLEAVRQAVIFAGGIYS